MNVTFFESLFFLMLLPCFGYSDNELQKIFDRGTGPVVRKTCDEIVQQFGGEVFGLGGGAMDVVRECHFTFRTYHPYSIEEGRRLIVKSTEIFLNNMNNARKHRPVLAEFPFPAKRVMISFLIIDPKTGHWKTSDSLANVDLAEGMVTYSVADPKTVRLVTVYEESFEDAQAIIEKEKASGKYVLPSIAAAEKKEEFSLVGNFFSALAALPGFAEKEKYCGPDYQKKMVWALDKFGCKLAQKHQLQFFRVGDFSDVTPYHYYAFSFTSDKSRTLEEGRVLGATLFEEIRQAIYTLPEVEVHRKTTHEKFDKNTPYPPTPDLRDLCFKVVFWDENVDRIMPPRLAQILLFEKVLSYYEADPKTQELRLVYQEPFEEALAYKKGLEQDKKSE